jgi:hypothetical protein
MIEIRSSSCRLFLAGLMVLAPFALAGCGSSGKALGTVEGKVTVDGSPANAGSVTFASTGGQSLSGQIQPDGTYKVVGVPVGPAKVFLSPPPQMPAVAAAPKGSADMPGGPATVAKPVPIPRKYINAESSGLSTTVKSGSNKYDIEATSK